MSEPARRRHARPRRRRAVDRHSGRLPGVELFDQERRAEPETIPGDEEVPRPARRSGRLVKRALGWLFALALIGAMAAAVWFGTRELLGLDYADYQGSGKDDVVIEVADGDSTRAIATTLAEADVVASIRAFLAAAENNEQIRGIRPGYYLVKTEMSGENAVAAMVDEQSRVGEVQLRPGTQLDDVKQPDGSTTPGVFAEVARATCAELNGEDTCISAEELEQAVGETDLAELGVPEWLAEQAQQAKPERRLEGLVMPGIYQIKPGWTAHEVLAEVLGASASRAEAAGLPGEAEQSPFTAYEIVVVASIIEREAVPTDFKKVSRVIYNRLDDDMALQMDSTINYMLDRPHIRTSSSDRSKDGPYNTYRNKGLTPTPISSPSPEAIAAALSPEEGNWLYFVKCEDNGLSCFTDDLDEHERNVQDARDRGVW